MATQSTELFENWKHITPPSCLLSRRCMFFFLFFCNCALALYRALGPRRFRWVAPLPPLRTLFPPYFPFPGRTCRAAVSVPELTRTPSAVTEAESVHEYCYGSRNHQYRFRSIPIIVLGSKEKAEFCTCHAPRRQDKRSEARQKAFHITQLNPTMLCQMPSCSHQRCIRFGDSQATVMLSTRHLR